MHHTRMADACGSCVQTPRDSQGCGVLGVRTLQNGPHTTPSGILNHPESSGEEHVGIQSEQSTEVRVTEEEEGVRTSGRP